MESDDNSASSELTTFLSHPIVYLCLLHSIKNDQQADTNAPVLLLKEFNAYIVFTFNVSVEEGHQLEANAGPAAPVDNNPNLQNLGDIGNVTIPI